MTLEAREPGSELMIKTLNNRPRSIYQYSKLRGFRVKIVKWLSFFCRSIPKGYLNTHKQHQSFGARVEYRYIERGLLKMGYENI